MTDPRKGTKHRSGPDADALREIIRAHLMDCTERGARAVGCSGASFVTMGMGVWVAELAELDGRATAALLRALADVMDPAATPSTKRDAETRRRAAVAQLHRAVDLAMTRPQGQA